jgi:methionyl-tRNA formyltransferase
MKVALIGGVSSTLITLNILNKYGIKSVDVYGYEPINSSNVSGYRNLMEKALLFGYSYIGFDKINIKASEIKNARYDYIFVVGLSQLVADEIILSAKIGCIGFHPTKLPKGRGRAPIAWLILEENEGAATFFQIQPDQDADAGPILAQSCFMIDRENDTVASVEKKILDNIVLALDELLPKLLIGVWEAIEQDRSLATEYGVRKIQDGYIDWTAKREAIKKHIRSAIPPHPGAFAFIGGEVFQVRLSTIKNYPEIKGVIGRVLKKDGRNYLVQVADGCIWIETDYELRVGMQLGVCNPYEFYVLNKKIKCLENEVCRLVKKIDAL